MQKGFGLAAENAHTMAHHATLVLNLKDRGWKGCATQPIMTQILVGNLL